MDTRIVFPEPCRADWEAMTPDGRARQCDACRKPVHDLSRFTVEEADALLTGEGGPACLRAWIAADGAVTTLPSRSGRRLFASVMPVFVALTAASAQAGPARGEIGGVVRGAGNAVTVVAEANGVRQTARTDSTGRYWLGGLPAGTYALSFATPGGRTWTMQQVPVRGGHLTVSDTVDPGSTRTIVPPPLPTAGVPMLPPSPPKPLAPPKPPSG